VTSPDLTAFLQRKKRETPPLQAKITGKIEPVAKLKFCNNPDRNPNYCFSLRPTASGMPYLAPEIIGRYLYGITLWGFPVPHGGQPPFKKQPLKPHLKDYRCIPPQHNGAFTAAMEDGLAVYARPYHEPYPLAGMDHKP
jgi:hypothetical protein